MQWMRLDFERYIILKDPYHEPDIREETKMGWKNVRDHYRIEHIVKLIDGTMHIGSPLVGSLVTVTPDGEATVNKAFTGSAEIHRYCDDINADPNMFMRLMASDDVFAASIPVYTWDGGRIVEQLCEEFGWPNVTHDGDLMYQNTHFLEREEALQYARRDAHAKVATLQETVEEARQRLAEREALLARAVAEEASLNAEHA